MHHPIDDVWTGDETFDQLRDYPIFEFRRSFLKRRTNIESGMRVLEAGSGPAHDSLVFAEMGAEVTAFDQSEKALMAGREEYRKLGYPLETICGDLKAIPVEDNTYPLVWSAGVLEHFTPGDDICVVKEMIRIARPGGVVLVIVPNRLYFWYQFALKINSSRQYHYERAYTRFSLVRLMKEAGLRGLKASGDYVHPDPSCFIPGTRRMSKKLEKAFMPLENSNRFDAVKSLLGLEIAVWGFK